MDKIFENLYENISEACFEDIVNQLTCLLEFDVPDIDFSEIEVEKPESYKEWKKKWDNQYKKDTTKNQRGEFDTKKKQFPKAYKEIGNAYGEPNKEEVEAERAERRSIARHKKKKGLFENLRQNVSESCFKDILNMVEEYISEVSKDWLDKKEEHAREEKNRAVGNHSRSMTPENPEGDPELFKSRQCSIERFKKFKKRKAEYLENKYKKEKKEGK